MTRDVQSDRFAALRQNMVNAQLRGRGILDERVLAAMGKVPRHLFVGGEYQDRAYEDHPLSIGEGQTISQPYIVAFMLQALSLSGSETVLEIGTGSGYLTALLAEAILRHQGYSNIRLLVGDGSRGLVEYAPFDAIVVSAAAPEIPQALLEQLREGGKMVVPVGPAEAQKLQLVRRQQGHTAVANLEKCRFVPLIGEQGYAR